MTYLQTLEYLYSQLPMFQRIGTAAYKANLDNTIAICSLLKDPQQGFKSIHIAGTNGKGSTSHMLASILQSSGLRVGLYTSPHLKDFRERIKINGQMIPEQYIVDFVARYKEDFERIKPSFFEMTVGLAFDYFAKEKVDVAVIETGLGGRLDSTNIIHPLLSVITNISFDHVGLLGDTLEKIAEEKAGIIKTGVPVVIGETQPGSREVFIRKAASLQSPLYFADREYDITGVHYTGGSRTLLTCNVLKQEKLLFQDLHCELPGLYQVKNIKTVLKSAELLRELGFSLTEAILRDGIARVVQQTGLLGRWQILTRHPLTIADTGHNEAGIREVLAQIGQTPHEKLHVVMGMVRDKDITKVLGLLPSNALYYFCKADIPRAMPEEELFLLAEKAGLKGSVYASVKKALEAAQKNAGKNDLVFVGGSTFVVAEVV